MSLINRSMFLPKQISSYVGNKSKNLHELQIYTTMIERDCFIVPSFIVLPSDFLSDKELQQQFLDSITDNQKYSVRSSGSISAPGCMETVLNATKDNIIKDIEIVDQSTKSVKLKSYLSSIKVPFEDFKTEIIIQNMVMTKGEFISGVVETGIINNHTIKINAIKNQYGDKIMSGSSMFNEILTVGNIMSDYRTFYKKLSQVCCFIKDDIFDREDQEIEFLYDLETNQLYILQSRKVSKENLIKDYSFDFNELPIVDMIVTGKGTNINSKSAWVETSFDESNCENKILIVTGVLDFENVSNVLKAKGIIGLKGGEMSHSARLAKEFGIPTVVGVTQKHDLNESKTVYFNNAGFIYELKE